MKICSLSSCDKKVHAHGLCGPHAHKLRRKLNPLADKEYEKTPKGFLMRLYRNMKSRIKGVQKKKFHLYEGKYLLPKQEFYSWAEFHPQYVQLFNNYVANGHDRKLAPSVDRINPDLGYIIENMEWVTMSENSRRSSVTRKRLK